MINKSKIIKDAQKFVAKAQWDKAITEYEKILAESPADANTHNTVGDLYLKKNDSDKAIISYKKAADIFNRSGFTLKSIALYKKVLNCKPDEIDILLLMGKLNAERGMLGNANENYLAAAAYFTRHGQRLRAIDVYKTLCDLNPENINLAQTLAELYMSEGFDSDGVIKHIELAEKKLAAGDLTAAGELLQRVSGKGSIHPQFIRVSASLDLQSGRLTEAAGKLEGLLDDDPGDVRVMTLLAEAYFRSGQYGKAAELYGALLQKEPGNMAYRRLLIEVYLVSRDFESAWRECRTQVEAHTARSEMAEAERLLEDFLLHNTASIEARQELAALFHKTGREDDTARLHMEMADLYFAASETEKAANIYRELLEKDPDNEAVRSRLARLSQPVIPTPPELEAVEDMEPAAPSPVYELDEAPAADIMESVTSDDADEGVSGTIYELPEEPVGLSPQDVEDVDEVQPPEPEENAFELPDEVLSGLEELDIFGMTEDGGEPQEGQEGPVYELQEGMGGPLDIPGVYIPPQHQEESVPAADESLSDSLAEIDAYIGSGLIDKAMTALTELEGQTASNTELMKRRLEVCKSLGDVDGFVDASVKLAGMYRDMDQGVESERVIKKAMEIDPGDDRLTALLEELSTAQGTSGSAAEAPEEAHEEEVLVEPPVEASAEAPEEVPTEPPAMTPAPPEEEALAEPPAGTTSEAPEEVPVGAGDEEVLIEPSTEAAEMPLEEVAQAEPSLEAPVETEVEAAAEAPEEESFAMSPEEASAGLPEWPTEEAPAEAPEPLEELFIEDAPEEEAPAETPVLSLEEAADVAVSEEAAHAELSVEPTSEASKEAAPEEPPEEQDAGAPAADDIALTADTAPMTPGSVEYLEELSEADFYAHQGLKDEAALIYKRLLEVSPGDESLKSRYEALLAGPVEELPAAEQMSREEGAQGELINPLVGEETREEAAAAAPMMLPPPQTDDAGTGAPLPEFSGIDELNDTLLDSQLDAAFGEMGVEEETRQPEGEFFDLAAILKDELDESGPQSTSTSETFTDRHLEEVFLEFKKGVEEQLGKEDYETHYNLGIAYKEMGMLDEALSEFNLAALDPSRGLECASMRGLCFLEKGDYDESIRQFQAGLEMTGREKEEYMGLNYDLATAYELKGDIASAQRLVDGLFREDEDFRDVGERLQRLNNALVKAGMTPLQGASPGPDKPDTPPKKSRVSYL